MFKTFIWVVVVLFSSQLKAEKIYKWVDENGQIHYSSQKPVDQEAETMKLKKPPKKAPEVVEESGDEASSEAAEAESAENESEADEAANAAAKAKLAEADRVNNKKLCDLAKKNYAALNATVRVTRTNDKGETVRMSDSERVNALQTAQQGINQYCQ